jgi:hypothetical protein
MMELGQAVDVLHSYGVTTEDMSATILLSAHIIEMQARRIRELDAELTAADKALARFEERSSIPIIGEVGDGGVIEYWDGVTHELCVLEVT